MADEGPFSGTSTLRKAMAATRQNSGRRRDPSSSPTASSMTGSVSPVNTTTFVSSPSSRPTPVLQQAATSAAPSRVRTILPKEVSVSTAPSASANAADPVATLGVEIKTLHEKYEATLADMKEKMVEEIREMLNMHEERLSKHLEMRTLPGRIIGPSKEGAAGGVGRTSSKGHPMAVPSLGRAMTEAPHDSHSAAHPGGRRFMLPSEQLRKPRESHHRQRPSALNMLGAQQAEHQQQQQQEQPQKKEEEQKDPARSKSPSRNTLKNALQQPLLAQDVQWSEASVRAARPKSRLQACVDDIHFELFMALVIVVNAIFTGFSAEYAVHHYNDPESPSLRNVEVAFTVIFTIELSMRFMAHSRGGWDEFCDFFTSSWNLLDTTVVSISLIDLLPTGTSGPNVMAIRTLRLFRLMRVFRVMRVARFMSELRSLVASIVGSVRTLLWSMLLLGLIQYMFGLVFLQATASTMRESSVDDRTKDELMAHFGSLRKTMLTLYMATTGGDDWGPMAAPLATAGWAYYCLFLFYISFLSMAILNLVMGLFVDAAMKAAEKDRVEAMKEARDELHALKGAVLNLFMEYDDNGDGMMDLEELTRSYSHPKMQAFLEHIEVDHHEVSTLFNMLDKERIGKVHIPVFVEGCFRMRRNAKSIDVMLLMETQEENNAMLRGLCSYLSNAEDMVASESLSPPQSPEEGASSSRPVANSVE